MAKEKKGKSSKPVRPVFFDPTSHRYALVIVLSGLFLLLAVAWAALFAFHLYESRLFVRDEVAPNATEELVSPPDRSSLNDGDALTHGRSGIQFPADAYGDVWAPSDLTKDGVTGPVWHAPDAEVFARVQAWSQSGIESAKAHFSSIDVVMPEWYELSQDSLALVELSDTNQGAFRSFVYLNRGNKRLLPIVKTGAFQNGRLARLFESTETVQSVLGSAVSMVIASDLDGICFDFTGADLQSTSAIVSFAKDLREELAGLHRESCIIGGMGDALWEHRQVNDIADKLIVLGFQEPGPFDPPAPLAPQGWFEKSLADLIARIDPEKLVVGVGSVGYDWVSGASPPDQVDFYDVTGSASYYDAEIRFDRSSQNTAMSYIDENGRLHQVWLLDALSAHNELLSISSKGIGGVAVWSYGHEDPGVWSLLERTHNTQTDAASLLNVVEGANDIRYVGRGSLLTTLNPQERGARAISVDPDSGMINGSEFLVLPKAFTIAQRGYPGSHAVVLTFDDGPSEEYTTQILDILQAHDVPAVFFVVGTKVLENPEIARRILSDGHELGVHTFSHPSLDGISEVRLKFELHASQELLASVVNEHTFLFRAPYGIDENPDTPNEAKALKSITDEGYIVVGVDIDSKDWTLPGAEKIVENVFGSLKEGAGNVILMHDAGGDRTQTVAALGDLIDTLQTNGYTFVPLSSVVHAGEHELMAEARPDQGRLSRYSFQSIRLFNTVVTGLFFVLILAGVSRTLIVIVLALLKNHRPHESKATEMAVTVAIPAYCEETVIAKSIAAALASDYPNLDVIVVDDGSTDETARVVRETFGADPRVRLVCQKNQGKAEALNHAYRIATSPIVVSIDADTIICPDAISALVGHFHDPEVGAVAGNVKVGNRRNLLTRLQAIEYITSQNLDRRAYEVLNGIMVIPGAIGAWRKTAVIEAGGYTTQTLVEDADITVSIIRAGYRAIYEPKACAYTEAPETIRQWMRQRLRWNFGMLQIAWKHKRAFLERRAVGMVSIPDLLIFSSFVSVFAPLADLVLIVNVANFVSDRLFEPFLTPNSVSVAVIVAYLAYLLSDLVLAALALSLEPEEDKWLLAWALTQRFFYRQLYWLVALRAIARALTGRFTGWHKITRTATVSAERALATARASRRVVGTVRKTKV